MDLSTALRELGTRYGIVAGGVESLRLDSYLALLQKWSRRMNLTGSTGWTALSVLFEEALWAASLYPKGPRRHLDIGSGAGFPAVPLKIVRPSIRLCLLESSARKAAFLETVALELGLQGVEVEGRRAEEFLAEGQAQEWDAVSWKGLKLSREALRLLLQAGKPSTQYWLFHGAELPLAEPEQALDSLHLLRRESFPGRPGWHLSIFAPK